MDSASLKYAATHEWVAVNGNEATIGITPFAVNLLSDLVFVDLPAPGKSLKPGDTFGEIESVKAVSDLYAPCAGVVAARNDELLDRVDAQKKKIAGKLELLTNDPLGAGWLIKLTLAPGADLSGLMDFAAYEAHCKTSAH